MASAGSRRALVLATNLVAFAVLAATVLVGRSAGAQTLTHEKLIRIWCSNGTNCHAMGQVPCSDPRAYDCSVMNQLGSCYNPSFSWIHSFADELPTEATVTNITARGIFGLPAGCTSYGTYPITYYFNATSLGTSVFPISQDCQDHVQTWNPGSYQDSRYVHGGSNTFQMITDAFLCQHEVLLTFHYQMPAPADRDADGVPDASDNCLTTANSSQSDDDGDGVGNACDNCPQAPNGNQLDQDGDAIGNTCDNCRDVTNPDQQDADNEGSGDPCDNCPDDANPDQADADGDGLGDLCDDPCLDMSTATIVYLGSARTNPDGGDCLKYSVWVPTDFQGTLCVAASDESGTSLVIRDLQLPDGSPMSVDPVAGTACTSTENKGWHYFRVENALPMHSVRANFRTTGAAQRRPWNFWFWPAKGDRIRTLNGQVPKVV